MDVLSFFVGLAVGIVLFAIAIMVYAELKLRGIL